MKKLMAMVLAHGAMFGAFGAWNGNLSTLKGDATAANGTVITGTLTADVNVSIAAGATVTLHNATITNAADSGWGKYRPGITCLGDATIILDGTNTVKGLSTCGAGIFVPEGNTLTIKGSGLLAASSGGINSRYGTGIGCMPETSCGNIVVEDGTIIADGGYLGAGIGSYNGTTCGVITISGGKIVAKGGYCAAGIGTAGSSCAGIVISGGIVTAEGGSFAPGIGCGWFEVGRYACGDITISGGTVYAKGGMLAAGIGTSSYYSHCGDITIGIGITEVSAEHGEECDEAIGVSASGYCGAITIAEGLDDTTDGNVRTIKSKPVSVKFNENWVGGKTTTKELYRGDGVLANAPADPKREGWCFYGWLTAPEDGEMVTDETVVSGEATYYAQWGRPAATFAAGAVSSSESKTVKLTVFGGSFTGPSSVKVFMTYQTAAVADLDLANAIVNGVKVKGGLKFPLTLAWDTGDVTPYVIEIPLKGDKQVEDDETVTFQLADVVGTEMGETDVCTVTVEDPAFDELRGRIETGTATKAESNSWIKVSHDGIPYFRGLPYPADGGKVTGSAYCPENKKVTLKATANKGFAFAGWTTNEERSASAPYPEGYFVATTPSLVIDRTTKPAKDTKTSTTISNLTESTTFYAVFEGDARVTATPVAFTEDGGVVASEGGKVTGAGRYAPGKKVTLKATANKGFVFGGWYETGNREEGIGNSDEDGLILQAASFSFEMGEEDVDLYARFVTSDADAGSIAATFNGAAMPNLPAGSPAITTNVWCGVYLEWPLTSEALSQTAVKVSGLPSGLKFTAKDIIKKGSKTEVEIPANTIYGAPTAASKAGKDGKPVPSKVKVTVTTAGKSSATYEIALTVDALPNWAVGDFNGECRMENGELCGIVSALTIAANGKISGKILEGGRTWSLSAGQFNHVEHVEQVGGSDVFHATVIGKAGKEVVTNEVTVSATEVELPGGSGLCGVANGKSLPSSLFPLPSSLSWTAWQNLWKRADTKASQLVFKKNIVVEHCFGVEGDKNNTVKFTFKKDGAVSFSGKKDGVSVSGSSQLTWNGEDWCFTFYAPPKKGFDGYFEIFPVKLTRDDQNIVTEVEIFELEEKDA